MARLNVRWLPLAMFLLTWMMGEFEAASAEPPQILVATKQTKRIVQGLAGEIAQVVIFREAGDTETSYYQLNERARSSLGAHLFVLQADCLETADAVWCERLYANGVRIVQVGEFARCAAGNQSVQGLKLLHRALVEVFPDYRQQIDSNLLRELKRIEREANGESWAGQGAAHPFGQLEEQQIAVSR